ncbi:hypothetical protein [uncultured Campylobacter sp.]|uniref:hypothetical protein n=1 Tax=uncultured Campylobacter sp. TaxID=218934 RepID=UPI00260A0520|nr:hypothetical protein [uncultured Campylobacter sp.]
MALFKAKSFLGVAKSADACEFFYRKLGFGKRILDEKSDRFPIAQENDLATSLAGFADLSDKNLISCVLIDDENQRVHFNEDYMIKENSIYQKVDDSFIVEFPRASAQAVDETFGIEFSSHTSLFKILYFLLKNQNDFENMAMFALKFNNRACFVVANQERVLYADMVRIDEEMQAAMNDADELFYELLNFQIETFYKTENSEFLTNVFIYSDGTLSNEIGYVIFTRIYIKTNLKNLNFADYINKIAMLEAR